MLLSGQVSDWSVEDLLQMLHITKKTASLHVDGAERSGVVYFDAGAIVGAEVSVGATGDDREAAVEALYVLQLLDEGEFEIRNQVPPTAMDPMSVADALELASEHLAAERTLGESGLLGARRLRLAQQIDDHSLRTSLGGDLRVDPVVHVLRDGRSHGSSRGGRHPRTVP